MENDYNTAKFFFDISILGITMRNTEYQKVDM